MFDASNFLMRWLFLCQLARDISHIQTMPQRPNPPVPPQPPEAVRVSSAMIEDIWKDSCLRGIISCPPGRQRCLVLDALRTELVQKLTLSLQIADGTLRKVQRCTEQKIRKQRRTEYQQKRRGTNAETSTLESHKDMDGDDDIDADLGRDSDPQMDADTEILKSFEQATILPPIPARHQQQYIESVRDQQQQQQQQQQATIVMEGDGRITNTVPQGSPEMESPGSKPKQTLSENDDNLAMPSQEKIVDAQQTIRHVRDYLPQLVSAVLKSPLAFDSHLVDPVQKLRRLLVERCLEDANWGIHMCWLLEAEVGRAWKTLFENRQQTGKRLIIVMPADKAAVIAKIGKERREAFELLQDAEQATAYGYTQSMDRYRFATNHHQYHQYYQYQYHRQHHNPFMATETSYHGIDEEELYKQSKLPSSLSLRRCSHFGDTMHFVDLMTKISLDLRHIQPQHRTEYLHSNLREINRRLRRRMVTRGDISLDVVDNRGPDDWPLPTDISVEMLRHSVHLPLDPMQSIRWNGGTDLGHEEFPDGGVARVLNIVVDDCRLLSSRERCPYLVHAEVAETGLRGNDARLYASGVHGLGATVEEALGLSASATKLRETRKAAKALQNFASYEIPPELLPVEEEEEKAANSDESDDEIISISKAAAQFLEPVVLRGGWQADEAYYPYNPDAVYGNPYDTVRQDEYEQLHEQLFTHEEETPDHMHVYGPESAVTIGEALLDNVFGQPWAEKCEEIRQTSAFGKVKGWRLASFIMKAGEDIRRESLVMQVIYKLNEWFKTDMPEQDRPHMRPYTIMCVGGDAGIVECLSDAKSIDEVKKRTDRFESLRDFFERAFGPPGSQAKLGVVTFEQAQDNFLRSLVGYSLVCYILQIKDRHNANILLDREGNIMHIDFGFVLGDTPKMGKVPIFSERAPFKLSGEFWDVLGGWSAERGGLGVRFCQMFEKAFACAATHVDEIASLVEATMLTLAPTARTAEHLANGVKMRLRMRGPPGSREQQEFIVNLVDASLTSWGTSTYDWLQKNMNGYQ